MGDERNGGFPDRRHARPEATAQGPERSYGDHTAPESEPAHDDSPLAALLAAAIRGDKADGEAESRALAAFRAARDTGAHRARTRRRDDWRPRAQRRTVRSLRTTLSVLLASLTLGGVAYAAIGSTGTGPGQGEADEVHIRPSVAASTPAEAHGSSRPSTSAAPTGRPPTAQDTLAHCRAYEKLRERGKAPTATAFRRLVTAAGGEADVSAYCAALTAGASDADDTDATKPGKQKAKANAGNNAAKNTSGKR
jgi:hypothetical protein